jgi:tetratricopeptide (TPR) repeat protein
MLYIFDGRFEDAREALAEEQFLNVKTNHTWGIIRNRLYLGILHLHQGHYREALESGQEAVSLSQEFGLDLYLCDGLIFLAQTRIAMGNYSLAREKLQESDRQCPKRMSDSFAIDLYWAILEAYEGRLDQAWKRALTELTLAIQGPDQLKLAAALAVIAFLKAINNEAIAAVELYSLARQHPHVDKSHWFADVVGNRVEKVAVNLPQEEMTAANARGREMDMRQAAESWLEH